MHKKIGVLGGGQLGRMMGLEAPSLGIELHFLDQRKDFPAGQITPNFTIGNFNKHEDVVAFGLDKDAITIEIENVSVSGLEELEKKGIKVYPQAGVIKIIQDKGLQKDFYKANELPSSAYLLFENAQQIKQAIIDEKVALPFVQKSRTAGYDGKGVQIIKTIGDLENLFDLPSVVEDLVDIDKELAVIVARSADGQCVCYPLVEMEADHEANLLDKLICPAQVDQEIAIKAEKLSIQIAEAFGIVGLLAVELFLDKEGSILINEVAPRTHNSGHHTIDNNYTSQFAQLVRCVAGLPLGSTQMISPAVMVNLLGEKGKAGAAIYDGLEKVLEDGNVFVHIYGKAMTKPYRKMGHINILDQDINEAIKKADIIKQNIKVTSNE